MKLLQHAESARGQQRATEKREWFVPRSRESIGLVAKSLRLMKSLRKDAIALKGEKQVETGRLFKILFLNYLYYHLIRVLVTATNARDKMRSWSSVDRAIRVVGI